MSNVISSDLCHQTSNLKKKILNGTRGSVKKRGRYVSPLLHKDGPWLCFNVILIIKGFQWFQSKVECWHIMRVQY